MPLQPQMLTIEIWEKVFAFLDLESCVALANSCKELDRAYDIVDDVIAKRLEERAPWIRPGSDGIEQATWQGCGRQFVARKQSLGSSGGGFRRFSPGSANEVEAQLGEGIPIESVTLAPSLLPPSKFLVPELVSLGGDLSADIDLATLKCEAWQDGRGGDPDDREYPEFHKYGFDAFAVCGILIDDVATIEAEEHEPDDHQMLQNGSQLLYSGLKDHEYSSGGPRRSGIFPFVRGHPDVEQALVFSSSHRVLLFQTQNSTFAYCGNTGGVVYIDVQRRAGFEISRIESNLGWDQTAIQEHNGLVVMRVYDYLLRFFVDLGSLDNQDTLKRSDRYPDLDIPIYEVPMWIHRRYHEFPEVVGYHELRRGHGEHKRFLVGRVKSPRDEKLGATVKKTLDVHTGTEYLHVGLPGLYLAQYGLGKLGSFELSKRQHKHFVDQARAQAGLEPKKWKFEW